MKYDKSYKDVDDDNKISHRSDSKIGNGEGSDFKDSSNVKSRIETNEITSWLKKHVTYVALLLVVTITTLSLLYFNFSKQNNNVTEKYIDDDVVLPNEYVAKDSMQVESFQVYEDESIKFEYPSDWVVVEEIPKFVYDAKSNGSNEVHVYRKDNNQDGNPEGDSSYCNGPILINPNYQDAIIMIDAGSDNNLCGPFLQSRGPEISLPAGLVSEKQVNYYRFNYPENFSIYDRVMDTDFTPSYNSDSEYEVGAYFSQVHSGSMPKIFVHVVNSFEYKKSFDRPEPSTIVWKQYRNEELGFSFEYPSYWGEPYVVVDNLDETIEGFQDLTGYRTSINFSNLEKIRNTTYFLTLLGYSNHYDIPSKTKGIYMAIGTAFLNCEILPQGPGFSEPQSFGDIYFITDRQQFRTFKMSLPLTYPKQGEIKYEGADSCYLSQIIERDLYIDEVESVFAKVDINLNEFQKLNVDEYLRVLKSAKILD